MFLSLAAIESATLYLVSHHVPHFCVFKVHSSNEYCTGPGSACTSIRVSVYFSLLLPFFPVYHNKPPYLLPLS